MRLRPIALVAGREVRERSRQRTMRVTTLVLAVAALAAVIAPSFFGGDDGPERLRVAAVPDAAAVIASLQRVGQAEGIVVDVRERDSEGVNSDVRAGDVDVGLLAVDDDGPVQVLVRDELGVEERGILTRALGEARVREELERAGAGPGAAERALTSVELRVTALSPSAEIDDRALFAGVAAALALVLALVFAGTIIASGVAEEKTTRISEVLLAAMRSGELLAGKVVGVGLLTLGQIVAIVAPAALVVLFAGTIEVPAVAMTTVAAGVLWFLIGFLLYSVSFGALGALVAREQEVGMAIAPLTTLLWAGYLIAVFGLDQVQETWFRTLSLVPFLSPMLMPMRMVTGTVGAGEVLVAIALTGLTAMLLVWIGGRVYRAGLVASGPRVPMREALARAVARD